MNNDPGAYLFLAAFTGCWGLKYVWSAVFNSYHGDASRLYMSRTKRVAVLMVGVLMCSIPVYAAYAVFGISAVTSEASRWWGVGLVGYVVTMMYWIGALLPVVSCMIAALILRFGEDYGQRPYANAVQAH